MDHACPIAYNKITTKNSAAKLASPVKARVRLVQMAILAVRVLRAQC